MADKLVIKETWNEYSTGFSIQWECDDELGAVLGDEDKTIAQLKEVLEDDEVPFEDKEHVVATLAIQEMDDPYQERANLHGFMWESRKRACVALRVAKAAAQAYKKGCPLPDWAKQAIAAGWKQPKGWHP